MDSTCYDIALADRLSAELADLDTTILVERARGRAGLTPRADVATLRAVSDGLRRTWAALGFAPLLELPGGALEPLVRSVVAGEAAAPATAELIEVPADLRAKVETHVSFLGVCASSLAIREATGATKEQVHALVGLGVLLPFGKGAGRRYGLDGWTADGPPAAALAADPGKLVQDRPPVVRDLFDGVVTTNVATSIGLGPPSAVVPFVCEAGPLCNTVGCLGHKPA